MALTQHPHAKALFLQACETATGVSHPIKALSALCHTQEHCLCIVDGITHVGLEPLPMDAWGVDILLGATQKSFMMSAGLCIVALSERAWRRAEHTNLPRFYAHLPRERQAQSFGHTAWTSAVSLVYGLDVSLQMMRAEGKEALYARHSMMAEICRGTLFKLGCNAFAQPPACGLTVVRPPVGYDASAIIAALKQEHGMRIGGGQDALAGQILRVAHMGDMDVHDVRVITTAIGDVLGTLEPL